ncbi:UPF0280 family protein [Acidimangrovimonas pyrenivorans]|uniref:UPF0280 family protein n=1 Tax=Acidimangrovimonas pyrenivorans TaxID=2030798 RepID=A0ABV7AIT3_9RHOB
MTGAQAAYLADRVRLHLNHGPIDLILWANQAARREAYERAAARFSGLLEELVAELPELRSPAPWDLKGPIARRMAAAVAPFAPVFITPMAAVAGAVADAVLAAMAGAPGLSKAHVNNGGDIAFHLTPGEAVTAAVAGARARVTLAAGQPERGLATSGWRGRSHSLGIADAVTVLARTAAEADAAATLIANAVDLPGHPAVIRQPACALAPDSDLGDRLVTVDVGPLTREEAAAALDRGLATARDFHRRGLIGAALLSLSGQSRSTGAALASCQREPADEPEHV